MATMSSKHVNISDRQDDMLKRYAGSHGISYSEALRRVLDEWMKLNFQSSKS